MRIAFAEAPAELAVRDTGSDPKIAARLFRALAADPTVLAVVAPVGAKEAEALAPLADQLRVPLLLLAHAVGVEGQFVVSVAESLLQEQARILVDHAIGTLRAKRLGVLYPNDESGRTLARLFRDAAQRRGASIVGAKGYTPGKPGFSIEIAEVERWTKDGQLDALMLADQTASAIALGAALRSAHPGLALLGTDAWNDPARIAERAADVEGVVFAEAGAGAPPSLQEEPGKAASATEARVFATAVHARQAIENGAATREEMLAELARRVAASKGSLANEPFAVRLLRVHHGKAEPLAATVAGP
ncbi:MAG: hypothetical protein A3J75_03515 [Acidobacteria bacterium RBG_16_68_9]|nr:MAG: hypothetical protein A3J75_03515 [Acidobacteria bacterium RBG_16_68_9]